MLVLAEALGLLVFVVATAVSGIKNDARTGELIAQLCYFTAIMLFIAAVGNALLRGRRWGRTAAIVVQIIVGAIGIWLITGSGQWPWGIGLIAVAVATGILLLTRPATEWIGKFPALFGPDES